MSTTASLQFVHAATQPGPLQWNLGSDIGGCLAPHCPSAPVLPASPPGGAALEDHPETVTWGTDSQTVHWSNL